MCAYACVCIAYLTECVCVHACVAVSYSCVYVFVFVAQVLSAMHCARGIAHANTVNERERKN